MELGWPWLVGIPAAFVGAVGVMAWTYERSAWRAAVGRRRRPTVVVHGTVTPEAELAQRVRDLRKDDPPPPCPTG